MAKVNGEEKNYSGKSVTELLDICGYDKSRVAVELNGEILPKNQYDSRIIADDDTIEIVSFVGGG